MQVNGRTHCRIYNLNLHTSGKPIITKPQSLSIKLVDTEIFQMKPKSGADTGFPVGGGANPGMGAPTYKFAGFSQKLHEIKKILVRGEGGGEIRHCKLSLFITERLFSKMEVLLKISLMHC